MTKVFFLFIVLSFFISKDVYCMRDYNELSIEDKMRVIEELIQVKTLGESSFLGRSEASGDLHNREVTILPDRPPKFMDDITIPIFIRMANLEMLQGFLASFQNVLEQN